MFGYGDIVRVSDDMVKVHSLQPGHGEWNDDMALVRIQLLYHSISGKHQCIKFQINVATSYMYM